jgi:hypothetical protein
MSSTATKTSGTIGCGFLIIALVCLAVFGSCDSEREINGKVVKCSGLLREKTPGYTYDVNVKNIAYGAVFFQTLIVPAMVAVKELQCPIAEAQKAGK